MVNEDFKGMKVLIDVGEPWNFKVPSGGNKFNGTIIGLCKVPGRSDKDLKNAVLINVDSIFSWEGAEIKQITASHRYEGEKLSDLLEKKELNVNMARVKELYIDKQDRIFLMAYIEPFAIGSMSRV